MAKVTVKVSGVKGTINCLTRINEAVQREIKDTVAYSAIEIHNIAKESMSESKSGRIYKRGNVIHRASAPGEAPATDQNSLKPSIRFAFSEDGLTAEVGTDVKYGPILEFGTSKIAPRPWLTPSFEQIRPRFIQEIQEIVKKNSRRTV